MENWCKIWSILKKKTDLHFDYEKPTNFNDFRVHAVQRTIKKTIKKTLKKQPRKGNEKNMKNH